MRTKDEILSRIDELKEQKEGLVAYLKLKCWQEDWHGVEDTGSDIRDVEAMISALKWALEG